MDGWKKKGSQDIKCFLSIYTSREKETWGRWLPKTCLQTCLHLTQTLSPGLAHPHAFFGPQVCTDTSLAGNDRDEPQGASIELHNYEDPASPNMIC